MYNLLIIRDLTRLQAAALDIDSPLICHIKQIKGGFNTMAQSPNGKATDREALFQRYRGLVEKWFKSGKKVKEIEDALRQRGAKGLAYYMLVRSGLKSTSLKSRERRLIFKDTGIQPEQQDKAAPILKPIQVAAAGPKEPKTQTMKKPTKNNEKSK
jgi:hypothetical protein